MRPALAAAWEFVPIREDAEDLVQDTFARTWRELARYDATRPFAPWFFTILRNTARNASRRDRRWQLTSLTDDIVDDARHDNTDAPDTLDRLDITDSIHAALDALSPMQRACFRLTDIEGFTGAEAAAMLGISDATVRVHAHRARRTLRARLAAERGMEQI